MTRKRVPSISIWTRHVPAITVRPIVLVAHVALTCALGLVAAVYGLTPVPARVDVDLTVSAGTTVALFVNDLARPPQVLPLVPGERHTYRFEGIVENITMLRVDPTDVSGATIDFHSITVVGADGIQAQFSPQALAGWASSALTRLGVDAAALHLTSTTADPILTASMAIPVGRRSGAMTRWLPMVNVPDIGWRLAAASLALLVAAAALDPVRRLYLPIAAAAIGLVVAVLALAPRLPDGPASAAIAVSRATFLGQSTRPALIATLILITGAALIGAAAARLDRRKRESEVDSPRPAIPVWQGIVGVLLVAVAVSPDLRDWAAAASTRQYVPHWDSDNLVYWAYTIQRGKLPLRDFWYPYGGAAFFDLAYPVGATLQWLYNTALFGAFAASFARWRGFIAALVATSLLVLGHSLGMFPGIERYLLAVNVILAYLVMDREGTHWSTRVVFWIAAALLLLGEPPQLAYAAIPIALMIGTDVARHWRTAPSIRDWLIRRLVLDFGVLVALSVMGCVLLALSGQLRGFLGFYGRLGDVVAYSTWPTGLPELKRFDFSAPTVSLACATVLMAIGAYEHVAGGRRVYGDVLAGLGIVTLMVLQKHFLRWMDDQLYVLTVVGILALGWGWPGRRRVADYVAIGAIFGALAAALLVKPSLPATAAFLARSPLRALSDFQVLTVERASAGRVNAARFAPDRFTMFLSERKAVAMLRARSGATGDVRVFALTDNPVLYILTGQPTVWMSNLYNASPVYEQAAVVQWIEQDKPPYAIFDPDRLSFDNFQMPVRVPLVFSEVVSAYVPLDVADRLQILRRRASGEPIALAYWRERLGSNNDVGRLASISSFAGASSCSSTCGDLLEVQLPPGGSGPVSIPMTVNGLPFSVSFTRMPDETAYDVLLDRVWFWEVAKRNGLAHALDATLPPGVSARVRQVPWKPGVLY